MDAANRLTVLVPLKDRVPFTLRLMAYANRVAFPFPMFLADGGSDDGAERALADPAAFGSVRYEYRRYPTDSSYGTYWAKLADALGRIQTPFVALVDNDDFLVVSGARAAVEFMIGHDDYASCGGQCAIFWLAQPGSSEGDPLCYSRQVTWKCSLDPGSLDHETARERIRRHSLRATHPVYYHVRRTADLKRHAETIRDLDLKDPFLIERLLFFLTATDGKTKQLDRLYIARQWNAPGSDALAHQAAYGDWLGRMLVPSWSDDFRKFLEVAASALARHDGLSLDEARRTVSALYRLWLAPPLLGDLMSEPTVTLRHALKLRAVRRLLDRPDQPVRRVVDGGDAVKCITDVLARQSGPSIVQ